MLGVLETLVRCFFLGALYNIVSVNKNSFSFWCAYNVN